MNQQDGDFARLVGLHHVQAHDRIGPAGPQIVEQSVGVQQADRRQVRSFPAGRENTPAAWSGRSPTALAGRRPASRRSLGGSYSSSTQWLRAAIWPVCGSIRDSGRNERRDRKTQTRRIILRRHRLVRVAVPDGDQRHAQPMRQIQIFQPRHFVIGNELEPLEILGPPAAALQARM